MIRVKNEVELLEAFRPLDFKKIELPDDLSYPFGVSDYLSWEEPNGHWVNLLLNQKSSLMGIRFRKSAPSKSMTPSMCSFCHYVGGQSEVSLITALAHPNRNVGIIACRGLNCKERLTQRPGLFAVHETLTDFQKQKRILDKMHRFAIQNLF